MKRILIAEDDLAITDALALILGAEGYEVIQAKNRQQIVRGLAQNPQLILLDIRLSGADGSEICKELKADPAYKDVPVVLMSANPDIEEISEKVGADGFIRKPFEMSQLLTELTHYLAPLS